jgi:hypothetical protein
MKRYRVYYYYDCKGYRNDVVADSEYWSYDKVRELLCDIRPGWDLDKIVWKGVKYLGDVKVEDDSAFDFLSNIIFKGFK